MSRLEYSSSRHTRRPARRRVSEAILAEHARRERVARARRAAVSPNEDLVAGLGLCRDDRCTRVDLHPVHSIPDDAPDPFYDSAYPRARVDSYVVQEIVYDHLSDRRCKLFRDLLEDVRNDYGDAKSLSRNLYRALNRLIAERKVVAIGAKKKADWPMYGYVRGDSPLLRSQSGLASLAEQLDEQ